jgi:formylmethanofuran dehydrogenase subunit E
MSQFEQFECRNCGESFTALPDANAGRKRLCSPACESDQLAVGD